MFSEFNEESMFSCLGIPVFCRGAACRALYDMGRKVAGQNPGNTGRQTGMCHAGRPRGKARLAPTNTANLVLDVLVEIVPLRIHLHK